MTVYTENKASSNYFEKPRWYWLRLRQMSLPEIIFRLRKAAKMQAQRKGFFLVNQIPKPDLSFSGISSKVNVTIPDKDIYIRSANKIVSGDHDIFALKNTELGPVPQWNRDPLTGKNAPISFGKLLDYRDATVVGDIKYLWEPNRHLHLVVLAQAYHLTGDDRYIDSLEKQLNSWFEQCPYPLGPNWSSSLEVGIRLINWCDVWHLCGGADSPLFKGDRGKIFLDNWLTSIFQHAHFIQDHFSRYSSANNHLIGEAAGLFIATITWPYWRDFKNWQCTAYEILVHEALMQNTKAGVNREQAISYQQFVLDFLIIAALVGRANNVEFPDVYWERIERMLEYLASIMDVGNNVPMIGDADDGYVVRLSQEPEFCPYRSLLATGSVLFSRVDFKDKAGGFDDKSLWLLGNTGKKEFDAIEVHTTNLPVHREFLSGGYYILGTDFETEKEIRLVVDAGPLGYQSIAAHGHADALAFTLSISGREMLVDPGTYSYHTKKEWRNYFRGTSAHNTVRVDGENQSVIGGNFMWIHKADAKCEVWEPGVDVDRFVGQHDGYVRLPDSVTHRRDICFYKQERKIVITDMLICQGSHLVERFWHFSEQCNVTLSGSTVLANNGGICVKMVILGGDAGISIRCGEINPPGGWVSRSFDVKVPTSTVVACSKIQGNTTLVTEIICE